MRSLPIGDQLERGLGPAQRTDRRGKQRPLRPTSAFFPDGGSDSLAGRKRRALRLSNDDWGKPSRFVWGPRASTPRCRGPGGAPEPRGSPAGRRGDRGGYPGKASGDAPPTFLFRSARSLGTFRCFFLSLSRIFSFSSSSASRTFLMEAAA